MRQQGCKADAIVCNAIIDASWETGVIWAQRKACSLPACLSDWTANLQKLFIDAFC